VADIHPASLKDAKELARQRMLDARALAEEGAKQEPERQDDDDEPTPAPRPAPAAEDEDPDPEPDEGDDEDEGDDDEPDSDDESDDDDEPDASDQDDDAEDDEPPARAPQKRAKPSRRSKKIQKLQETIAKLEANSATQEERLLQRLQEESARRAALEAEQRQREAEDRAIESEMQEYLGSDDDYRKAIKAALNGDVFEAEKARGWDERREIFGKLVRRAEARVNQQAAEIYWRETKDLPGIDARVLEQASFGDVLKHLHKAGYATAVSEANKEIARLEAKIARLEAQATSSKVKKVAKAAKADPVEGGTSVRPSPQKSIYEQAMDPITKKIDRQKFQELRRRAEMSSL
jgi:hypothetical protein